MKLEIEEQIIGQVPRCAHRAARDGRFLYRLEPATDLFKPLLVVLIGLGEDSAQPYAGTIQVSLRGPGFSLLTPKAVCRYGLDALTWFAKGYLLDVTLWGPDAANAAALAFTGPFKSSPGKPSRGNLSRWIDELRSNPDEHDGWSGGVVIHRNRGGENSCFVELNRQIEGADAEGQGSVSVAIGRQMASENLYLEAVSLLQNLVGELAYLTSLVR